MFHRFWKIFLFLVIFFPKNAFAQSLPPAIGAVTVQTTGNIEKYAKFEVSFSISTSATNVYFPYDPAPPSGVTGTGITVDMLLLPPGESNWSNAKTLPCFYFQPYQEVGTGGNAAVLPFGPADWRCRFTPDIVGNWQYKIRAVDSQGTIENNSSQFTVIDSNRKGFIRVSQTDPRFFEFSNGEPFTSPLINIEEGSPFSSLSGIKSNIQKLGQNGIRFVRWLPTAEGANYFVIPWGDQVVASWAFGNTWGAYTDIVDTGKRFSYNVYYYSQQSLPLITNSAYRLTVRANIAGEQVLRLAVGNATFDICSSTNVQHATCSVKVNGWSTQSVTLNNTNATSTTVFLHGLYVSTDAPSPYNSTRTGTIRISSATLQRDETGSGGWGPNLLTRGESDTYDHVDQVGAARLDEVFKASEQYGVYHKLPLFEKNDEQLNRIQADGSLGNWINCGWGFCPNNFYSAPGQAVRFYRDAYTRYFVARWSYSTSLHSLELANETDLYTESYNAGWDLAQLVKNLSPRPFLMSNSFWGYFADPFFTNVQKGNLLDFGDQHLYGSITGNGTTISTIWSDSAGYVRECWNLFKGYKNDFSYNKPIVRGEGGTTQSGTQPQHPQIAQESTGVYYHKKVWAHVGNLGFTCDGEWYPRTFTSGGAYPNATNDTFKIYKTYENFIANEPVNNGNYQDIGTDLTLGQQINISNQTGNLRAFGVRDSTAGKVLLWIDNANQTWKNVVDGVVIAPASGTLTLSGLTPGNYTGQWWDTRTGTATTSENFTVSGSTLNIVVSGLATDKAIKLSKSLCQPLGNIDCQGTVNVVDLSLLISKFGGNDTSADLDSSGKVNVIDLSILLSNFGQ